MWRRLHGERHREVVSGEQTLAEILADRGQWRESERRFRSALANAQSVLGQTHPLTLRVQSALADFLFARDRVPEALHLREAELAAAERAFGTNDVYVARALTGLGVLHASSRNLAKAEPYLRRSLEVRERIHPRGHWRIAEAQLLVAAVALQRRRYADAEALLRTASAALESNPAAPKEEAARARRLLALAVAREPGGWSAFTFQSATGRAH
jgi:tetratricopeptide (TPR) repeat protein